MTDRRSIDEVMAGANPFPESELRALPLDDAERELELAILAEERPHAAASSGRRAAPRRARVAIGALALAAVAVVVLVIGIGGGYGGAPAPAFGAELVRLAKASPLVLLDEPGWHVNFASERSHGRGVMRFRRVGARTAVLRWRPGTLDSRPGARGHRVTVYSRDSAVRAPVVIYGSEGTGPRRIVAVWEDDHRLIEFSSVDADLSAFERHLEALRKVRIDAWIGALPERLTARRATGGRGMP